MLKNTDPVYPLNSHNHEYAMMEDFKGPESPSLGLRSTMGLNDGPAFKLLCADHQRFLIRAS